MKQIILALLLLITSLFASTAHAQWPFRPLRPDTPVVEPQVIPDLTKGIHVIVFGATWCNPCHKYAPTVDKFKKANKDASVIKADFDANNDLFVKYEVSQMPTTIILVNGEVKFKQVGILKMENLQAQYSNALDEMLHPPGPDSVIDDEDSGLPIDKKPEYKFSLPPKR